MAKLRIIGRTRAFTLLEVLTVIVVIAILSTMVIGSYVSIRDKARRSACENNLRNLHVAMDSYLSDNDGIWPQVPANDLKDPNYPLQWISVLRPYKLAPVNWICPSVQAAIGVDYNQYPRLDYLPTPFGNSPRAAYRFATQPWFVERADIHGDGNLLIFANGEMKSLNQVVRGSAIQAPPQ
jgi:prepilin-type N-terminal cleavage/methylation domain-containing protein